MAITAATVQTGSLTIVAADGLTEDVAITSVTTSRSIVMFTEKVASGGTPGGVRRHNFFAEITSSTNIRFTRGQSSFAVDVDIEWTVVEFDSGVATIQSGTVAASSANEDVSITAIDTDLTYPITGLATDIANITVNNGFTAEFTTTTNLRFAFHTAPGTDDATVGYQVVEFSSGATVQTGTITMVSADPETETASITAVDLTSTYVSHGGTRFNGTNAFDGSVRSRTRFKLNSSTVIEAARSDNTTRNDVASQFYVVELEDGQTVESFDVTITDGNTTPTQPSFTAVDDTKSAIMNGNWTQNSFQPDADVDGDIADFESRWATLTLDSGGAGATFTRVGTSKDFGITGYVVEFIVAGAPTGNPRTLTLLGVG